MLLCLVGAGGLAAFARREVPVDAYHFWEGSPLARGAGREFYSNAAAPEIFARMPEPASRLEAAARDYWQRTPSNPNAASYV
ncbi:MAG TPA: hypothetical protein VN923_19585 [Thermoanaerobaculia bacterium]|nr:hypothetical protein [Thermoanaerobaculia bacterium]